MVEVFGDSSRNGDWACVRLRLDGDRIVEADADGLDAPLQGLTLLEAAAVGGETLPVDALANAIGPVFHAPRSPERVAVAMSGGVDSAVTLLRAGKDAIGVTLRLWLDPAGPDAERACCSPEAVLAARETCHRLRPAARHARSPPASSALRGGGLRRRLRRRRDAESLHPLQRQLPLRGTACVRRAAPAPHALATGHYARIADPSRPPASWPARATQRKDQSYMLAGLDPAELDRVWFPLGDQTKEETREEAARAGLAAAGRAESQEACFLAGGDYRDFLAPRGARPPRSGEIVDEDGTPARHARRPLGVHSRASAAGSASPPASRCTSSAPSPRTNRVVVGGRDAPSPARTSAPAAGSSAPSERAEAKLRYRSPAVPADVRDARGTASGSTSTSRRTASRPARRPSCTKTTRSSASGIIER